MLRALSVTTITFLYIFLVGTPFLIHALIVGNTKTLYRVGVWGAKLALWLSGVRIEAARLEKIPVGRAVVYMANHQSNVDGPALFTILPPLLILAKKEFFGTPILGRGMKLHGFVAVDRKNREKAIEAVEEAARSLKAGNSFMVFPEGTRSPDGRLRQFKKGVFVMAIKAGAPVVPISVSGSRKIMAKGKFAIRPGAVCITFHDPVPTEGCTLEDRDKIMETVRQAIMRGLAPEEWPVKELASDERQAAGDK